MLRPLGEFSPSSTESSRVGYRTLSQGVGSAALSRLEFSPSRNPICGRARVFQAHLDFQVLARLGQINPYKGSLRALGIPKRWVNGRKPGKAIRLSATYTWFIRTYILLRALTFCIIQEHRACALRLPAAAASDRASRGGRTSHGAGRRARRYAPRRSRAGPGAGWREAAPSGSRRNRQATC
jgi:hypothetical protein